MVGFFEIVLSIAKLVSMNKYGITDKGIVHSSIYTRLSSNYSVY